MNSPERENILIRTVHIHVLLCSNLHFELKLRIYGALFTNYANMFKHFYPYIDDK